MLGLPLAVESPQQRSAALEGSHLRASLLVQIATLLALAAAGAESAYLLAAQEFIILPVSRAWQIAAVPIGALVTAVILATRLNRP